MDNAIKGLGDEVLMSAALERVEADLAALKPDELLAVSLDISAAVATVLGVLPELKPLREQIAKELPAFNIARFEKLEDYAFALNFAHAKYLSATQPPDALTPVLEQASKVRERLLAEVNALVLDGLVAEAQLGQLKGANGYKNIATDVSVLANVLQQVWPQIQGKTRLTTQDLEEGLRLSARLLRIVGVREQGPAQVAEASVLRQRAYTLLLTAYDDARRAVAYLRAEEDDADDIAPPLHPGRPRSRKGSAVSQGAGPSAPAPSTGVPAASAGTGAGSAGTPGAPTPGAPTAPPHGAPGGPFVQ